MIFSLSKTLLNIKFHPLLTPDIPLSPHPSALVCLTLSVSPQSIHLLIEAQIWDYLLHKYHNWSHVLKRELRERSQSANTINKMQLKKVFLLSSLYFVFTDKTLMYSWILKSLSECDRMFISNPDGLKNGTFRSPHITNEQKHSRQCIYTFIAAENERVQISFSLFDLRGTTPE